MTKEEIIRFIDNNYADNEELVWQTVSQGDVGANDEEWLAYIENLSNSTALADIISGLVIDDYNDFMLEQEGEEEDENK
jgi:predicted DNA-binding protein (MmcQ/YjbR family)